MGEERVQRRLAAILAADVVGYSRLMEADEQGTLARLKSLRNELFQPKTKQYGGRIFKITGDGALVEFTSAVDAVNSAVDIQRALATRNSLLPEGQRIALRIGVSLGDVIVEGGDLYGNGVNVAARMQTLAEPGGICVSGNVHEHVGNVLDIAFEDLGDQNVKNIARPVRSYRIRPERSLRDHPDSQSAAGAVALSAKAAEARAETWYATRPALAVLPFANMSRDIEHDYFADGLTEDIITALSYFRSFAVIARNSTFAYKGQAFDIRKISADLGARYVIEGSVRRAGNRVRITVQLIDSRTGHHLWAERYDRELDDIFALQDEITRSMAAVIEAQLERVEQTRLAARPVQNLDAWEQYQRGVYFLHQMTKQTNIRARGIFQQAIALDPNYSRAHSGIAYTYYRDVFLAFGRSRSESIAKCIEAARRAVALDADDSFAHFIMSRALHAAGDFQGAIEAAERATKANPNDYQAWGSLGLVLSAVGRPREAIPMLRLSVDLNPKDPRAYIFMNHLARALIGNAEYTEAANWARRALQCQPANLLPIFDSHLALASALGHLGRTDDARAEFMHWRKSHTDFATSDDESWHGQILHECLIVGLRKAGLLEC